MYFWNVPRTPEPEEMDDAGEVESYSSAAAARHLDAIDNTFVEHLLRLLPDAAASRPLRGLDVGAGPAEIPIKLLRRIPSLRMIAIDRSGNMLARARQNAATVGLSDRLTLLRADAHLLPFHDGVFSMVLCNSVLHHARDPVALISEMARAAAPEAALLLRDLRRPARLLMRWHLWRHGRHYRGTMRRLFNASVRAAYTAGELKKILFTAGVERLKIFRFGRAHIGCERTGQVVPK